MKYLFWLIVIFFISCKPEKNTMVTIQQILETYFKPTIPDASSYEFVEITNLDTITEREYRERVMEMLSMNLLNADDRLKSLDQAEAEMQKALSSNQKDPTAQQNIYQIAESRRQIEQQQRELDSISAIPPSSNDNIIKFIQLHFAFKSANPGEEKTIHRYYIKLNEDLSVQSASELRK